MGLKDYASEFSTDGLLMMHKALRDTFDKDESIQDREEKPYGVRRYADWRQWSDALESALTARGESFDPVPW